jgi:hypothetical protein
VRRSQLSFITHQHTNGPRELAISNPNCAQSEHCGT